MFRNLFLVIDYIPVEICLGDLIPQIKMCAFCNNFENKTHFITVLQHTATVAAIATATVIASVSSVSWEKGNFFNYAWNFNKMLHILNAACKCVTYFIMIYIII